MAGCWLDVGRMCMLGQEKDEGWRWELGYRAGDGIGNLGFLVTLR